MNRTETEIESMLDNLDPGTAPAHDGREIRALSELVDQRDALSGQVTEAVRPPGRSTSQS